MRPMYYDKQGQPIGRERWGELLKDLGYRVIARTELGNEAFLSTVWLGIDHAFGSGPPVIFESLDFPAQEHMQRYCTEEEARAGHEALAAQLRAEASK